MCDCGYRNAAFALFDPKQHTLNTVTHIGDMAFLHCLYSAASSTWDINHLLNLLDSPTPLDGTTPELIASVSACTSSELVEPATPVAAFDASLR
jgi:hypothetical protein